MKQRYAFKILQKMYAFYGFMIFCELKIGRNYTKNGTIIKKLLFNMQKKLFDFLLVI